jgi:hypothetical protein
LKDYEKIIMSTIAVSAVLFTLTSCKTDFDTDVKDIPVTKGEADFSRYISLGNSLTSGYRDGALYSSGQSESYPSMIAGQMKLAGGGAFKQPLMPNNVGGFIGIPGFSGKLTLQMVNGSPTPVESAPAAALDIIAAGGPYQNMGVPGARVAHLLADGYGNPAGLNPAAPTANPYFVRFASSATTSVVKDALKQDPTFISLWIGNNDVLLYATSGGADPNAPITPVDGAVGVGFKYLCLFGRSVIPGRNKKNYCQYSDSYQCTLLYKSTCDAAYRVNGCSGDTVEWRIRSI